MPVRTWPGTIQCPGPGLMPFISTVLVLLSRYIPGSTPRYRLVCICFPTPGRGLPYGSGLGLSRCLGPGECLHSFIPGSKPRYRLVCNCFPDPGGGLPVGIWFGIIQVLIYYYRIATRVTMLPSWCENAADAVFSTPHSCLTTPCPTHCSPAHAIVCPIQMHRLILGLSTLTTLYTNLPVWLNNSLQVFSFLSSQRIPHLSLTVPFADVSRVVVMLLPCMQFKGRG